MEASAERVREEVRQKYQTKETFDLLEKFLVKQSQLSSAKALAFEQQIEEKTDRVLQRDAELGAVAVTLFKMKNQYLLLYRTTETKLVQLARSMIVALNSDNRLVSALCSKALLEHAAMLAYLVQQSSGVLDRTGDAEHSRPIGVELEELRALFAKGHQSARFFGQQGLVDSLDVVTLVDQCLSGEIRHVRDHYNRLLDYVHPAFAGNVVLPGDRPGDGVSAPSAEQKTQAFEKVLEIAAAALSVIDRGVDAFAGVGMTIEGYLQKAIMPTTTMSSFLAKKPEPAEEAARVSTPGAAVFFTKKGKPWLKY